MARPSKLTPEQWAEIDRRLAAGEGVRDLAREFGVSPATVSKRGVSKQSKRVQEVAHQMAAAQTALATLPVAQQYTALSLADELRAISSHIAGAARYGAATAHRLSGIAHAKVQEIDDAAPLDKKSMESLKGVAVLTRMANEASTIPLNLLAANKDTVKELNKESRPLPKRVPVHVIDASVPDAEAQ